MKKIVLFAISFLICLSVLTPLQAQKMPRKERKVWKKKIKRLTPEAYKAITEQYNSLKNQINPLKQQVSALETEKNQAVQIREQNFKTIDSLLQVVNTVETNKVEKNSSSQGNEDDFSQGVVFKVQIGSFRNSKLKEYTVKGKWAEEDEDGMRKFTIGMFRDYWTANDFKNYLREMGVKDAWIVTYENNERKSIKDVIQNITPKAEN